MSTLLEGETTGKTCPGESKGGRRSPAGGSFYESRGLDERSQRFSDYKGEHHLFFQYYPYETRWNSMHWGHAKSSDFLHWEYLPAAMAPDQDYDDFGVFSGSAIVKDGKQYLLYTGVKIIGGEEHQTQCLAVGDGLNYEKAPENPVIPASLLPEGYDQRNFRDPKVWKDGNLYYVIVGCCAEENGGEAALFSSVDLRNWKFETILDKSYGKLGIVVGVPGFLPAGR
ncbi:MAG: glycoside hydrolase family 32 protein [Lachnospiraceae bacterium]